MSATAYPLTWPQQFPRAKHAEKGAFRTTLASALKNVQDSLRLFAADSGKKLENVVISSNVTLGVSRPQDAGVAVWFTWDGLQISIAVDRYATVEANLQAIHHILEARRVELRHGTLALVRATFTGFLALPAPARSSWRAVMAFPDDCQVNADDVQRRYRALCSSAHPDRGGSNEQMAKLNAARDAALQELVAP